MSENQKREGLKKQQKESAKQKDVQQRENRRPSNPETKSPNPQNSGHGSESGPQAIDGTIQMTYAEAEEHCKEQMAQFEEQIQNQDLSEQDKQKHRQEAEEACKKYLENFQNEANQGDDGNENQQYFLGMGNMTAEQILWYQQQAQTQQFLLAQAQQQAGEEGSQVSGGSQQEHAENGYNGISHLGQNSAAAQNAQLLQQQQLMLQQHLLQNYTSPEVIAQAQQQYEIRMKKEMGNQLRIFASKMFKQVNKRQKKKLETKAKQYLDQCTKDQKKMQRSKIGSTQKDSIAHIDSAMLDFEFTADPSKYLEEINASLKKNKGLSEHFKRFQHVEFEDTEQDQQLEQVTSQFFLMHPMAHQEYMHYMMLYNQAQEEEHKKKLGDIIFNKIMPIAHQIDPILLKLIPEKTKQQFIIEYEENGNIKSWKEIDRDSDESDSQGSSDDDGSGESSDGSQSGGQLESGGGPQGSINNETSSELEDNDNSETNRSFAGGDRSMLGPMYPEDNDDTALQETDQLQPINGGRGGKKPKSGFPGAVGQNGLPLGGNGLIPQHALTGKNKSLVNQLNHSHPNQKHINKHELRPLDNFFRSLRDEKDWLAFCRLLYLYFEGVLSLKEFYQLYDEKFQTKLKEETKVEMDKLLPTRDVNRRNLSNLLKAWNDTENQTFEKVADSSYYKIDEGFPIPTCTIKMTEEVYFKNLNDAYLSLATGSENKRFRNTNEEKIYTTEDKMYQFDTQIDNIQKSHDIVVDQCELFEKLSPQDQALYKFPVKKLSPLRFYWDRKFKKLINEQYFDETKVLKEKEMKDLRKQFVNKLEYLKSEKGQQKEELCDTFRKNFTKSLDHKSFQFKDFMKKYQQKITHIQKIRQISYENSTKNRFQQNDLNLLYGSGEQPNNSDYRFYNSFGKDFGGKFNEARLTELDMNPDYPIDMKFMDSVSLDSIYKNQDKFPQARFLFNDSRTFDITLKLVIQNVKNTNLHHSSNDRRQVIKVLKFIMKKILMIKNFEDIESKSEEISPITPDMVEILMNSACYYQKKYDGELDNMCEVFTVDGFSTKQQSKVQSPLKNDLKEKDQNQIPLQRSNQLNLNLTGDRLQEELTPEGVQKESPPDQASNEEVIESASSDSNEGNNASSQNTTSKPSSPEPLGLQENFKASRLLVEEHNQDHIQFEKDMNSSIYIPKFVQNKDDELEDQYKLYYGPSNAFMFITFFYSVYERILKAQQLVKSKVEQDFKDDFSKRQWSVKFQSKKQALIDERFQYLVKAIYTAMCFGNILDAHKYEDVARELLGNEAYLLFQVDKLVNHCTKHLISFNIDNSCRVSQSLYRDFERTKIKSESQYLASFYKVANQCSIVGAGSGPQATGAAAAQKDPPMNQQAFRFMFSPKSKIMTVHNVILNPFNLSENRKRDGNIVQMSLFPTANGGVNSQEYLEFMKDYTVKNQNAFYQFDQELYNFDSELENEDSEPLENRVTTYTQPIFLRKNLRKMKQIRKKAILDKQDTNIQITQKHGLVTHMIPLLQQLSFQSHSEDVIVAERKVKILGKRKMDQDLIINQTTKNLLEKRFKELNGDYEEGQNQDQQSIELKDQVEVDKVNKNSNEQPNDQPQCI